MSLPSIFEKCGLEVTRHEQVHGGDINRSYCVYAGNLKYFLKLNDALLYPGLFEKEANGLRTLAEHVETIKIPAVINYGITGNSQFLLLQWLEKGVAGNNSLERFGSAMASLHQQPQPYFGWEEDNYIGNLLQHNAQYESWHLFYAECRILPFVQLLFNRGAYSKQDITVAEALCKKLTQRFPQEPASLLHGDLWAGNFMITNTGDAAVYDPAVYYGHREMDIGMTKLFGGFDQRFYDGYNNIYPLEKDWLQRLPLTQLYPLLVHALLFGGHYVDASRKIMNRFR